MKQIDSKIGAMLTETEEAKAAIALFQNEQITFDEAQVLIKKLQEKVKSLGDISEAIRDEITEWLEDTIHYINYHSKEIQTETEQNKETKVIKVIIDSAKKNMVDCIKYSINPENWTKNINDQIR